MKEDNNSKELINQEDMDSDKLKEKAASTASCFFFKCVFAFVSNRSSVFIRKLRKKWTF